MRDPVTFHSPMLLVSLQVHAVLLDTATPPLVPAPPRSPVSALAPASPLGRASALAPESPSGRASAPQAGTVQQLPRSTRLVPEPPPAPLSPLAAAALPGPGPLLPMFPALLEHERLSQNVGQCYAQFMPWKPADVIL
jgi:hypothetical protein